MCVCVCKQIYIHNWGGGGGGRRGNQRKTTSWLTIPKFSATAFLGGLFLIHVVERRGGVLWTNHGLVFQESGESKVHVMQRLSRKL